MWRPGPAGGGAARCGGPRQAGPRRAGGGQGAPRAAGGGCGLRAAGGPAPEPGERGSTTGYLEGPAAPRRAAFPSRVFGVARPGLSSARRLLPRGRRLPGCASCSE